MRLREMRREEKGKGKGRKRNVKNVLMLRLGNVRTEKNKILNQIQYRLMKYTNTEYEMNENECENARSDKRD